MKHLLSALLVVLFMASFGFCAEWRPFIGAAVREDIVIAQQHIHGYNDAVITPAYYPLGAQITAGLMSDHVSGYVAYFAGHSPTIWSSPDTEDRWDTQQITVGGRWHPVGAGVHPFTAFVGGGLTMTNSRYDITDYGYNMNVDYPSKSLNDLGAMVEFGLLFPVTESFQFTFATQLHRYETEFDEGHHKRPDQHYVVLTPAFQLGVQFIGPQIL